MKRKTVTIENYRSPNIRGGLELQLRKLVALSSPGCEFDLKIEKGCAPEGRAGVGHGIQFRSVLQIVFNFRGDVPAEIIPAYRELLGHNGCGWNKRDMYVTEIHELQEMP